MLHYRNHDPIYGGYGDYDDDFYYCWHWAGLAHTHETTFQDTVLVAPNGAIVQTIGSEGLVASEEASIVAIPVETVDDLGNAPAEDEGVADASDTDGDMSPDLEFDAEVPDTSADVTPMTAAEFSS